MPLDNPSVVNTADKILDCDDYTPWCLECLARIEYEWTDELDGASPGSVCVECVAFAAGTHSALRPSASFNDNSNSVGKSGLVVAESGASEESMQEANLRGPLLTGVATALQSEDPEGMRLGRAVRRAYDEVYDHQRTGRSHWDELTRIEKKHFGSVLDLSFHKEFRFPDGNALNHCIANVDVGCFWSQTGSGWMISSAAMNHVGLLVTSSDMPSTWSVGLIRVAGSTIVSGFIHINASDPTIQWIWRNRNLPKSLAIPSHLKH